MGISAMLGWIVAAGLVGLEAGPAPRLAVEPMAVAIRGSDGSSQLLVAGPKGEDRTGASRYRSLDPGVATVDPTGLIRPTGDGSTRIVVEDNGRSAEVAVAVADFANARPVRFVGEVEPILSKHGCNAGGCHGKSGGQNGFRLSLLGFDPKADHESLVDDARGRRVFPPRPALSLLVRKPTAEVPHGGGKKFAVGSPEYSTLVRWIGQGMPYGDEGGAELARLSVEPASRTVARGDRQQLRAVAHYADGSSVDVTRLAQFQSNALDLAAVDARGLVRALDGVGEAAIMSRFGGQVAVARVAVPSGLDTAGDVEQPSTNPIDPLVAAKLRALGLRPSPPCTDAEFARRSSLDIRGTLPDPAEVATLEGDPSPSKRAAWVDRLVGSPEYADLFAMKWSAILKNKRGLGDLSKPGSFAFHGWIRQAMAENMPYDRFVAAIVAARGDAAATPPVVWYRQVATLEDRVDDTAQLFLGIRIQCARCHHHPFEKWSQDDYYGFASIFSRVGTKPGTDANAPRVFNLPKGTATNPLTGRTMAPKPLGGPEMADLGPFDDPRVRLAAWLGQADNPYLARTVVNRYWKHFLGRGLVDPEDDMRASNPPSNPELLDALADDFVRNGYDLKRLVRTIASSRAYGRSSIPNESNGDDRRNYARFYARRLPAEIILDAVDALTGVPESFAGLPGETRAAQIPDDGVSSYFLDIFGRPKRESVCECERSAEANLSQTLHLLNSDDLQGKIAADKGRSKALADDPRPDAAKVDELYRRAFARGPSADEQDACTAFLDRRKAAGQSRQGFEDLIWTLVNTKEFLFNQ